MNFSETIATLNKASAFDLYRLRVAIDRVLGEPQLAWRRAGRRLDTAHRNSHTRINESNWSVFTGFAI